MTRQEHILVKVMEECNEVSQRCAKALRFGIHQVQHKPGDRPEENPGLLDNLERIRGEAYDLFAALEQLGITVDGMTPACWVNRVIRIEKYLRLAASEGTLRE